MTTTETEAEFCPCGKPLHYQDEKAEAYVKQMIAEHGVTVRLAVGGDTWEIPRHYLALHGIVARSVPELARLHNWRKVN